MNKSGREMCFTLGKEKKGAKREGERGASQPHSQAKGSLWVGRQGSQETINARWVFSGCFADGRVPPLHLCTPLASQAFTRELQFAKKQAQKHFKS